MASLAKPAAVELSTQSGVGFWGVSDLDEGGVNGNGLLAVEKSGANLGFGGGGHDTEK